MSLASATSRASGRSTIKVLPIVGGGLFMIFMALATLLGPLFIVILTVGTDLHIEPPDCSAECDDVQEIAIQAYVEQAEQTCEGLDWTILAGIGQVETRHGTLYGGQFNDKGILEPPIFGPMLDGSGVGGNTTPMPIGEYRGEFGLTGDWMQAMGPMQFLPATWAEYGIDADGDGEANPQSIHDAAASAAALLCDTGAPEDLRSAVYAYNHSWDYVAKVLHWASLYAKYGGAEEHIDSELLDDPRVCKTEFARRDLVEGVVDPRLVVFLEEVAERWDFCISLFRTGHAPCVINTGEYPDCRVSNHWYGRGVDISAVDHELVTPDNDRAREVVDWIESRQGQPNTPDSVGSPWAAAFGFTDDLHQDHLHIAFYSDGLLEEPGIDARPIDPPPRPVALERTFGMYFSAEIRLEPGDFEFVNQPLAGLPQGVGGTIGPAAGGEHGAPDIDDTLPECEHHNDEQARKDCDGEPAKPDDPPPADEPALIPLQPLVDATETGGVLVLGPHRYTGARITRDITMDGPPIGQAYIIEPESNLPALTAVGARVDLSRLQIEGGLNGLHAQQADVSIADVRITKSSGPALVCSSGTMDVIDAEIRATGGGLVYSSCDGRVIRTTIHEVGAHGVFVRHGTVEITQSNVLSTGDARIQADTGSMVIVEGSFIGSGGSGGGIVAEGRVAVSDSVFWSNGRWALYESAGVIAAHSNAIMDGSVNATWYRQGVTGESARSLLGQPWMSGTKPSAKAAAAVWTIPDLRSEEDLETWPLWALGLGATS